MSEASERRELLKRAFLRIEELEAQLAAPARDLAEPLAVVGMACRFPGDANDPDSFWEGLCRGVDATSDIPAERWNVDEYYDPVPGARGRMYTRRGAFLTVPVDRFDAEFFGIAPREADEMDPQQRLLLEVVWEALERGGHSPASLDGSATGVFIGMSTHDWAHIQDRGTDTSYIDTYYGTGVSHSVAAGRIAYILGLRGPAITIDTACSSSLVAFHEACQSLRCGETNLTIVAGVSLVLTPNGHVIASSGRMLAPDGRCKTFDAAADGYARGEGCGVVLLKRLRDAERDGDRVLAIVRGTAINQDGRSAGLTAPNGRAQQEVIRAALAASRLEPADVGFVEAHGTGTELGDPIEIQALAAVHGERRGAAPLYVASVKTNIGHLESAAGIAGVIKTVLALERGAIPAHLHFKTPNPHIAWERMPIRIPVATMPWPDTQPRRIAGVSSFGFSGTNAHVVLEAYAAPPHTVVEPELSVVLPLSARTPTALVDLAGRIAAHVRSRPDIAPVRMATALATGRNHWEHRAAAVVRTRAELLDALEAIAAGQAALTGEVASKRPPRVAFLFTGQGSQRPGMGRELLEREPVFRAAVERCDTVLKPLLGRSIVDVLAADASDAAAVTALQQTALTQPALFTLEWALAELWRSWGLRPAVVLGHSVGEYVAACVAGVIDLDAALTLIAERGRLIGSLPSGGAMAAIFAPHDRVAAALRSIDGCLAVAASNGPQNTVVSGDENAVDALLRAFASEGIDGRKLAVSHAFHSPLMEPIRDTFRAAVERTVHRAPAIDLITNLTAAKATADLRWNDYWVRHLREPVRFAESLAALRAERVTVLVEIGPAPVLLGLARADGDDGEVGVPSLIPGRDAALAMREAVARLFVAGVPLDWTRIGPSRQQPEPLPTYPFERVRHWLKPRARHARAAAMLHPLLGERRDSPRIRGSVFERTLTENDPAWVADHRVFGRAVFPAAGFLELASAASALAGGARAVSDLAIREPLVVAGERCLQTLIDGDDIEIVSRAAGEPEWRVHATARLAEAPGDAPSLSALAANLHELDVDAYLGRISAAGVEYSGPFRSLRQLLSGDHCARGLIALERDTKSEGYGLHPALLDAALQVCGAALDPGDEALYLPVGVGRFAVGFDASAHASLSIDVVRRVSVESSQPICDLTIRAPDGRLVASIEALRFQRASAPVGDLERRVRDWIYKVDWIEQQLDAASAVRGRYAVIGRGRDAEAVATQLQRLGCEVARSTGAEALNLDRSNGVVLVVPSSAVSGDDAIVDPLRETLEPVLMAAQAAARSPAAPRVMIVARNACCVLVGDTVDPTAAAVWGLGQSLVAELPGGCRRIDLPDDDDVPVDLAEALLASGTEDRLAWRAGSWRVARLGHCRVETEAPDRGSLEGAAWITGGLGGLGLAIALDFARRGCKRIALGGRTAPASAAALDELRALGADVLVVLCDVAKLEDVSNARRRIEAEGWIIKHVVHAAGVLDDAVLAHQTWRHFEAVLAPKAVGAWNLHRVTRDLALESFVLFSAGAALLGSPGQANYCAANGFLDGLARLRCNEGLPALSIAWGPWAEVGMAARSGRDWSSQGLWALSPAAGGAALSVLLRGREPYAAVLPIDWSRFPATAPDGSVRPLFAALAKPRSADAQKQGTIEPWRSVVERAPPQGRQELLQSLIGSEVTAVLGMDEMRILAPHKDLTEAGVDSLMAVELANRLGKRLGLSLSSTFVFEHPTVAAIAEHVLGALALPSTPVEGPGARLPLVPRATREDIELSFAQERLWFLNRMAPDSTALHIPEVLDVRGALDPELMKTAFATIVRRHEALRTTFPEVDGRPVQRILAAPTLAFAIDASPVTSEAELERRLRRYAAEPFDVERGPLVRAVLLELEPRRHILLVVCHHLVFDGWSVGVFVSELGTIYSDLVAGRAPRLEPLPIQYGDYSEWQRSWLKADHLESEIAYWRNKLAGAPPHLELPMDRPRPPVATFEGASHFFKIDKRIHERLSELAKRESVTPFMTLLAAFQVFLARYSGTWDVSVGSPVANRGQPEIAGLIGFFVNTVVMRAPMTPTGRFRDLLAMVKKTCLEAYAHQELPYSKLVEELRPPRDASRNPVFQVMFALQNMAMPAPDFAGLDVTPIELASSGAQVDLALHLRETKDGIVGMLEYATALFDAATIERMAAHYCGLLTSIIDAPDSELAKVALLGPDERRHLVEDWNRTGRAYAPETTLVSMVTAQAARRPDTIAVRRGSAATTYRQLECTSNQFARHLQAAGATRGSLVAVCLDDRSLLPTVLLGVLKAGAAYLPLDPGFPSERLAYMIEDSGAKLLIADTAASCVAVPENVKFVRVDVESEEIERQADAALPAAPTGSDRAYVIYTSGSTGRPKGVEIEHSALANFLTSMQEAPALAQDDVLLAITTVSFDIAALELLLPLTVGACIAIADRGAVADAEQLARLLQESRATTMQATPSTWRMLIDSGWRGDRRLKVLCGGEALTKDLAQRLVPLCRELWNLYGPTETTIWSAAARIDSADDISIGRPIANTQLYVLDAGLQPVPRGVIGELWIGGAGVGRGYLGRPDLTAERFVSNPYHAGRMYRTGDLARWRADGQIECLGRIDYQVKIRGYRIELGEIEAALSKLTGVVECAVVVRELGGDKRLVAFVVGAAEENALRTALRKTLPEYMVPSLFVALESLPRTPNQKIDRNSLQIADDAQLLPRVGFSAPGTPTEQRVAEAFEAVLGMRPIGRDHNFFELGGHSLLITKVITQLKKTLGLELPVRSIFESPTVSGLARYVDMIQWTAAQPAKDPDTASEDRVRITL